MNHHINSTRIVRTYNVATVLRTLYEHGTCSRTQLTKLTGMSPATITRIVTDLIEAGVVLEGRIGKSTGGRRPVYLHIDHTKLYIASVKLLKDDCRVALLDLKGRILTQIELKPQSFSPDELLSSVVEALQDIFYSLAIKQDHIIGIGVAVSGICHPKKGIVLRSINLDWRDVPVAKILEEKLMLPVLLENDANACALAELWLGGAKDSVNSMYIKTESGAGVGLISNKRLLTGPRFVTGEIGHIPLIPDGEICRCGQKGCLEPYVYFGDIQARYFKATGEKVDRDVFIELTKNNNSCAIELVQEAGAALALACAHWGILLDLDVITIGGFWGDFKEEIINFCQRYYDNILEQSAIPTNTKIVGSKFSEDADLYGAAGLVINHWFTPAAVPFQR